MFVYGAFTELAYRQKPTIYCQKTVRHRHCLIWAILAVPWGVGGGGGGIENILYLSIAC